MLYTAKLALSGDASAMHSGPRLLLVELAHPSKGCTLPWHEYSDAMQVNLW